MPMIISRITGERTIPEYTQAARDRAWEAIARAYLRKHPEAVAELLSAAQQTDAASGPRGE